jgi:glycosyltransferase involved in cell wall biosynthesis
MNITFLITMGIDRPSGRRYFNIARELARQGHTLRILALHPDLINCPQRRFIRDGVEVWYVGQMHARKSASVPGRFGPLALLRVLIASTLGMIWAILCSPSAVYHLGKPQPVNGVAAVIGVLLLRRQRFYVDCDDDEVHSNRLTASWQRAIFAFWQWLLPRLAAGVTVNTHALLEQMRCAGVAPVAYVPNGVDCAWFVPPPAATREALREALGLGDRQIIAYAGTLALQNHPVDLLLDAFAQVAAHRPDAVLLLIGGGEDLPLLRQRFDQLRLQDRVYFTGQVSHAAVRGYLSLAVMSVDPVRDDATARARSPLKLFESLVLGVPVITGDSGDRSSLLDAGRVGVLVPAGDPVALARGMLTLLDDPAQRQRLAAAGHAFVQQYDWSRLAAHWEEVYKRHPQPITSR